MSNLERERKFLIKEMPKNLKIVGMIEQGYLMVTPNRQLRVRIISNHDENGGGDSECFMCFKHHINETDRLEYELPINLGEAEELLALCKGRVVTKMRSKGKYKGKEFIIDLYLDRDLSVCEIEYDEEIGELPPFIGKEITGIRKYSNINLAK